MGLDINIRVNNPNKLSENDDDFDFSCKPHLSRIFCSFMCRKYLDIDHETEFEQISAITGVDISAIYEMEFAVSDEDDDDMDFLEDLDEDEIKDYLEGVEKQKEKLNGNIDKVLLTVNHLIEKLSVIQNLPDLLVPTQNDTLDNKVYFANFNSDDEGYNFGKDLRNFKQFLVFAKSKATTTVWFYFD